MKEMPMDQSLDSRWGYHLGPQVGKGPLGSTHAARQTATGTEMAIKLIEAELDRPRVAIAFNQALAASALGHPGIVDVIDVGWAPDGRPYLTSELLSGESLLERLARVGRVPPADVVDFARQAAGALVAAHAEGIAHGALAADKLFLVADLSTPRGERVKVLGFGMGALRAGAVEQEPVEGEPTIDGVRADVQALGAIMYRALGGTDAVASLRSINPDVPRRLEAVILRALGGEGSHGYQSMAALLGDLDQIASTSASSSSRRRSTGRLTVAASAVLMSLGALWCVRTPRPLMSLERLVSSAASMVHFELGAVRPARASLLQAAHPSETP
jgi:serine/threonine protein kinase